MNSNCIKWWICQQKSSGWWDTAWYVQQHGPLGSMLMIYVYKFSAYQRKQQILFWEYSLTKQLLKHLLCHCGVLWLFMVWLRVITYQLWVVLPLLLYHFVGITFMHLDREDTAIEDHVLAHFLIGWWCCWDFWIADRESYSPMGCQCNYACFMLIVIDVKILFSKLFLASTARDEFWCSTIRSIHYSCFPIQLREKKRWRCCEAGNAMLNSETSFLII